MCAIPDPLAARPELVSSPLGMLADVTVQFGKADLAAVRRHIDVTDMPMIIGPEWHFPFLPSSL